MTLNFGIPEESTELFMSDGVPFTSTVIQQLHAIWFFPFNKVQHSWMPSVLTHIILSSVFSLEILEFQFHSHKVLFFLSGNDPIGDFAASTLSGVSGTSMPYALLNSHYVLI